MQIFCKMLRITQYTVVFKFSGYHSLRTSSASLNYCINSVQKNDYENFLCTLLLPQELRTYGLALRAFNVEVATVHSQISNQIAGEMRFQFWEDSIDKLFEGIAPEHPVCQQMLRVVQTQKVSKLHLKRLISSRRKLLKSANFITLQNLEEYCDSANSPIYYVLLELAGIKELDADHAASHLGRAQGLTNVLRATLRNSQQRMLMLPHDILAEHNVSHEDVFRNKSHKNMKDVIFDIASCINQHIELAKKMRKTVNREARRIYLPIVPLQSYLKNLRSADFNIFDTKLQQKNHMLSLKLFCTKFFW